MTTYKHVYEVTFETHHNYDNSGSFVHTVQTWGQRHFPTAKKVSITLIVPFPAVGQVWTAYGEERTIRAIDGNVAWMSRPFGRHYNATLPLTSDYKFVR